MPRESLYPLVDPHVHGYLDVGEGNRIYWEECGNPKGAAAVVLHGGPGSGATPGMRRYFDPQAYRVVLFDQRGCGRSIPHASDLATDLSVNTTHHLLRDIETLRTNLRVDRLLVFGVSWGCTLGLAYAERHPTQVTAMVLAGVTTSRRSEIDLLYRGGLARVFPEAWVKFLNGVPESDDPIEAYRRLLHDPDPQERARAARAWTEWDLASSSIDGRVEWPKGWEDLAFQLARARICAHYFSNAAWLAGEEILRNADRLVGIPGFLINGRHEPLTALGTAEQLSAAWSDSRLVIVPDAGHSIGGPGMPEAIVAATDDLKE